MQVFVKVDEDNSADQWWTDARARKHVPKELQPIITATAISTITIDVTKARLEVIKKWCAGLRGWDTEPQFARYALIFETRGGKREGAGRKEGVTNKTPGASVSKTIRMTPDLAARAIKGAKDKGQSFQAFAADAIEAFLKTGAS